jgi:hypothetical protein
MTEADELAQALRRHGTFLIPDVYQGHLAVALVVTMSFFKNGLC